MRLTIENVETAVAGEQAEVRRLKRFLSFDDPTSFFSGGPPTIYLFDERKGTFPTGYLPLVVKELRARGFPVELHDLRGPPLDADPRADVEWILHHPHATVDPIVYQFEALATCARRGRGIVWAPTGSGKSEVIVALARAFPSTWLALANEAQLMDQLAERYEKRTGEPAGRIGDGRWEPRPRFTAATFQTLHARLEERDPATLELLASVRGLVVDECHVIAARTFLRVTRAVPNARFRFGFSGTPLARTDERSVHAVGALGPVIYRVWPKTLAEAGVIVIPRIRMVPLEQAFKTSWQEAYKRGVVHSAPRNALLATEAAAAEKPCLAFVKEIEHGRELERALRRAGVSVEFVWGDTPVEQRKAAIRRLEHGDVDVIVCSVVFQTGIDIPTLRSIVVGSGGKSVIAALQRVGRGMRSARGKATFDVVDVADGGNKHLRKHARERQRAYEAEGYDVAVSAAPAALPFAEDSP